MSRHRKTRKENRYKNNNQMQELSQEQALQMLRPGTDAGEPDAMFGTAMLYLSDDDCTQEQFDNALDLCHRAAETGFADAMEFLGRFYTYHVSETPSEEDRAIGKQWYEKAADAGNEDAMIWMATYAYDHQDAAEMLRWYRKAAELGNAQAMYNYGICFADGEAVEKDIDEAVLWYHKAAVGGYPSAMMETACCYEEGIGGEEDPEKAFYWYQQAAEHGIPDAMYALSYYYLNGIGTQPDQEKAWEWLQRSAKAGCEEAQKVLAENE